jgi:hypothetical protein
MYLTVVKPMLSMRIRIRILVRLCRLKKLDFDIENILYVGICHKICLRRYYESHLKAWTSGLFVNLGKISLFLDPDPYPGKTLPSQKVVF